MLKLNSYIARLRGLVGNRRVAPRYATHLEKSLVVYVHLLDGREGEDSPRRAAKIVGYTRDVSETGLGIVVPEIRLGGVTIVNPNRTLRILVGIPHEPVEMQCAPARYVRLEDEGLDAGYLVGVQIISMSKEDRARYTSYLKTFIVEGI
ncbi:MAG TPA: PilZ domain-containing protein [Pyrinomonadaceae bacterium]|jgi:hypothetical protein|nr:PilZ domain-containing protein [Pyrinomonadaceae bacterium]